MSEITFPNSPSLDEVYTAENGIRYKWDGEKWSTLPNEEGNIPIGGDPGQFLAKASIADYDVEWVDAAAPTTVGPNPPTGTDLEAGQLWWNDVTGVLYIYYVDENSSQWVQAASSADNVSDSGIEEAPNDGKQYGRQSESWTEVEPGGVTQIVAGSNVTISPTSGTGVVTVNSTGGGGSGGTIKADIYGTAKASGSVAADGTLSGGFGCTVSKTLRYDGVTVGDSDGVYYITFNTPLSSADYAFTSALHANSFTDAVIIDKDVRGCKIYLTYSSAGQVLLFNYPFDFAIHDNQPAEIIVGSGTVANTNIYGTAKAWGNVSADGTLNDGLNCTTVKTSTGNYTVTFNTPMVNANYSITTSSNYTSTFIVANRTANGFDYAVNTSNNSARTDGPLDFSVFDSEPAEVALTTFGDVINYNGASAWGKVEADGTFVNGFNVATVIKLNDSSDYQVTFVTPMGNSDYAVQVDVNSKDENGGQIFIDNITSTGFIANVRDTTGSTLAPGRDFGFSVQSLNALPPKGGTGTDSWGSVQADGTIDASFNVASVTRTAKGTFDIVFTTPMPNANYGVQVSACNIPSVANVLAEYGSVTRNGFQVILLNHAVLDTVDSKFSFAVNATNATLPSTITQEEADLIIDTIKDGGVSQKVATLAEEQPSGTVGGTNVIGWQIRTLNTKLSDPHNITTLASNQEFTLQPGSYLIEWSAPAFRVSRHQTRLYNVTDNITVRLGSSEYSEGSDENGQTRSFGSYQAVITSETVYRIEHYCAAVKSDNGLGINSASADSVFTQVTITDLAVLAAGGSGGGIEEAPTDGQQYARQNAAWSVVTGGSGGGGETKADIYGTAKAWVVTTDNNGTVGDSLNIASVTRTGTGEYDVVFTTPMPNANYAITLGGQSPQSRVNVTDQTTTGFIVSTRNAAGTLSNNSFAAAVFNSEPAEIIVGSGTVANTNLYGTAKAWANVAGDGTLRSGTNCSVSKTAVGVYAVTFTEPMPDDDYTITMSSTSFNQSFVGNQTVNGFTYNTFSQVAGAQDFAASFAVFNNEPAEVALTTFGDVINYSGASAWASVSNAGVIQGGMNVASVTKSGTGQYDIVFTTPMPNANYSVTTGGSSNNISFNLVTANGFRLYTVDNSFSSNDLSFNFAVHATNALPPKGGTGTDAWGTVDKTTANGPSNVPASFNVASVTRTGTGKYDVVFTTPMPTADYSVTLAVRDPALPSSASMRLIILTAKGTAGFSVITKGTSDYADFGFDFTVNATNAQLPNTVTQEQIESAINNPGISAWGSYDANRVLLGGLNIQSITSGGTSGKTLVVFKTPMPDANYSVTCSADTGSSTFVPPAEKTANGFSIVCRLTSDGSTAINSAVNFQVTATNALPPKGGTGTDAWATVDLTTVNGPCNVPASFNVASVTRTSTGNYDVVFTSPMPSSSYAVALNIMEDANPTSSKFTAYYGLTTTGFSIKTKGSANFADLNFSFSVNCTNATLPSTFTEDQIQSVVDIAQNPSGVAKAWVNFRGDSSEEIISSHGVSSVVRTAKGKYYVNLTSPIPVGTCAIGTCGGDNAFTTRNTVITTGRVSSTQIWVAAYTVGSTNSESDPDSISVVIF